MKKLPSHTTKYFAEQAYKLYMYNGILFSRYTTVQGVKLLCSVFPLDGDRYVFIQWLDDKFVSRSVKVRIQKGWWY